uniref:28 kDa Metastriate family member n=1 Tax=Rhipicephalus zambeziensis TaxID=60191 RepID=A0A224Y3C7_9ACAR
MRILSLVAFCILAISGLGAENTVKLPVYRPNGTIGEKVTLQVVAMYDSNFTVSGKEPDESEVQPQQAERDPFEAYLKTLFEQVQIFLHNHSIMINITVISVYKMDNLTSYTYDPHIINVNKTMDNIIKFGESQKKSVDTVFFLFTWPSNVSNPRRLFEEIKEETTHRLGVSEAATRGTFCSSSTSAALIRHKYLSHDIWSTEKAAMTIFGAQHFLALRSQDYTLMNQTFSRCPKHSGDGGSFAGC